MNLNTMQNVKAASEEILKADLKMNLKESQFPALEEWELVLTSGGEGMPVWG